METSDPWESVTFEGARRAQTREAASLSAEERLRWVCEISEVVRLRDIAEGRVPACLRPDRWDP